MQFLAQRCRPQALSVVDVVGRDVAGRTVVGSGVSTVVGGRVVGG